MYGTEGTFHHFVLYYDELLKLSSLRRSIGRMRLHMDSILILLIFCRLFITNFYLQTLSGSVVSALCVGLADTLQTVGPAFLEGRKCALAICCRYLFILITFLDLEEICDIAIQILKQKALCQQDPNQYEDDEPLEDKAKYDSVLISSVGDLV